MLTPYTNALLIALITYASHKTNALLKIIPKTQDIESLSHDFVTKLQDAGKVKIIRNEQKMLTRRLKQNLYPEVICSIDRIIY